LIVGVRGKIPELEKFFRSIGPVNIAGSMATTAASTATRAVIRSNPGFAPASASGTASLGISDADMDRMAEAFTRAMKKEGVGAAYIDGKQIEDRFAKNLGRNSAQRRRTG
jgi:hypothetical protein